MTKSVTISSARRLAEIDAAVRKNKEDLEVLKEERKSIEQLLLAEFCETGTRSVNVTIDPRLGVRRTVYLHQRDWWFPTEGIGKDAICRALRRVPMLRDLVGVSYPTNTLSSVLNERIKDGGSIPKSLAPLLRCEAKFSIRTIAAK